MGGDDVRVAIVGAGPVGLVLALALKEYVGIKAELYEKVACFHDDVGAGMGMYPNGLRVIRDLDLQVFGNLQKNGRPYGLRRWERHDGTEVAVAEETALFAKTETPQDEQTDLQSLGIRRWRLQKVLYDAVLDAGINVHFGKRLLDMEIEKHGPTKLIFEDDDVAYADLVFAVDGSRSAVRQMFAPFSKLEYTGVTCLMGMAEVAADDIGICFPTSLTTKCHGCYFPTLDNEQCFQLHFPLPESLADQGNWGTLSDKVGKEECRRLAQQLEADGWDEKYLKPLSHVTHAVRIGFCQLKPKLEHWVFSKVVLVGDAAHPPVPYTGQGAQMGLEDAGTLAILLQRLCLDENGKFRLDNFDDAMKIYEQIRIPRVADICQVSRKWGDFQQQRSESKRSARVTEEKIRRDVFFHETLPKLFPGVSYDYKAHVAEVLNARPMKEL